MTTQRIINFMAWGRFFSILSLVLVAGSLISLANRGLVLGLDFTGGTQIEVAFNRNVDLESVRGDLRAAGFDNPVVVYFGAQDDVLIRLQAEPAPGMEQRIVEVLGREGASVELRRLEYVGPQVGDELRDEGGLGILAALLVVMLYVSVRFQYKFAIGAVVALIHDVAVTLGFFSVLGIEFDLTVLAAVLAVIGYSLNDTIIVFDRIRENFRLVRVDSSRELINESITQTLIRTLYTSMTTLMVLVALFIFGGELIHNFATALIVGIVVGTYSSIYVAAYILLLLSITRKDLVPSEKPEEEFDGLP